MKSLQGWGRAKVFREGRVLVSPSGEQFVSVALEFEPRPRGFAQRIEFRSWQQEDIDRVSELRVGYEVKFRGDVDACVMVGSESKVFANPRVTGRIVRITKGGAF